MSVKSDANTKRSLVKKLEIDVFEPGVWTNRFKLYLFFCNFVFLGISIVLFVFGILYLTKFKHEYDFTQYSISFIAGFFVAVGAIGFIFILMNFFACCYNRSILIIFTTLAIILLFIVILMIGIISLSVNQEENLSLEIAGNMAELIRNYDEKNSKKLETVKMDYLQQKFQCCGITEPQDWRLYYIQFNATFSTTYPGQTLRDQPFYEYVADSCCIDMGRDCGKRFNAYTDDLVKKNYIFIKGCQRLYQNVLSEDLNFLGGLSVILSVVALILQAWLIVFYVYIRKRSD